MVDYTTVPCRFQSELVSGRWPWQRTKVK